MRTLDKLSLRVRSLFRKQRVDEELDAELGFHLEQQIAENRGAGMNEEEARHAALRAMGGVAKIEDECRDQRRINFVEDLRQDLRYAWRMLWKSPAFTTVAVISLALGIGANTAIFTVINSALLRPLPFPDPDRLVAIWEDTPMFGLHYSPAALGNYSDWKAQSRSYVEMGALESQPGFPITGLGEPEEVHGAFVTASLLRTLQVRPMLGRWFDDAEDMPGAAKTAILSHSLWQRKFAGQVSVLGATITIAGEKLTIVGVMPPDFRFPDAKTEIWASSGVAYGAQEFANHSRHNWMVVGRLKPGVARESANREVKGIMAGLARVYPQSNSTVSAFVAPLREHMVDSSRERMYGVLMTAVLFVLLIACANVANLMLSRAVTRDREIAVRASLGAGRLRVARQLFTEYLLLALVGGAAGIAVAMWSMRLFRHLVPAGVAALIPLTMDGRVLLYTLTLTTFTCLLFSLAPVVYAYRTDVNAALKQSGGRAGRGRAANVFRKALVVSEVALALVLLIGASLLIRTFAQLRSVDPGFKSDHVLMMRTSLVDKKYRDFPVRQQYYRQALARVNALPGVKSAGFTLGPPLAFKGWLNGITLDGQTLHSINYRPVTPEYLRTIGIPLRRGRYLDERDVDGAPRVAVINEAMARRFWPDRDALGQRFAQNLERQGWITVVGIVGDVRQKGLDVPPVPEMYLSYEQERAAPAWLTVRTSVEPMSLAEAVRREIAAVAPSLPVTNIQTMEDVLDEEVFQQRVQMLVLVCFAGCALALAMVGIYGVLSYLVTWRTREIGVRMALGAGSRDILASVAGQGILLIACGLAVGLTASAFLTKLMKSVLYGVKPTDPLTFIGVPVLFLIVGVLASYIPARRAMKLDPASVLRNE